jgi:transcriptional regulator NrdR family protein
VLENDIHSVAKKRVVTTEEIERRVRDASTKYLKSPSSELNTLQINETFLIN